VILDEVHERSIESDFLLIILRVRWLGRAVVPGPISSPRAPSCDWTGSPTRPARSARHPHVGDNELGHVLRGQ
jgi:hypothetical protein